MAHRSRQELPVLYGGKPSWRNRAGKRQYDEMSKNVTVWQTMAAHEAMMDSLKAQGVIRSSNAPLGDLAEWLCCTAFGWARQSNSHLGFDGLGADGTRYEIKARRNHTKLSAIRDIDKKLFDYICAVRFDKHYKVTRAALIPHAVIKARGSHYARNNQINFNFTASTLAEPGVVDVTQKLQAAQS
jgi:hypothetical protein